MALRARVLSVVPLLVVLVVVVAGARVLGSRGTDRSDAAQAEVEAERRAAGFVNRLSVVNMLDVPIMVNVVDVDPAQWGRTPPDDEPPAGLEAEVIDPHRVSGEVGLRPLRIVDGGGTATFTITVSAFAGPGDRTPIGAVPTKSTSIEYCTSDDSCVDGYGYLDWQDAPVPTLDVFRRCIVDERVIGSYVDDAGVRRDVVALFQCDATRFRSTLSIHD